MTRKRRVLLITGTRESESPQLPEVLAWLDAGDDLLIVGDCPTGIDAQAWRELQKLPATGICCKADWPTYNKAAGPRRNAVMVQMLVAARAAGADALAVAFPSGGPGTADCIRQLTAAKFEVALFPTGVAA
jgi:hypothetical protein